MTNMPILSHIKELRRCLIISTIALFAGFLLAFPFYEMIIDFLSEPLTQLQDSDNNSVLFINNLSEALLVKIKISAIAGLIISGPIHVFNFLSFVLPGLIKKEKRILLTAIICSLILSLGSFVYSYKTIIPVSVVFMTGAGFIPENTGMLLSFSGNLFYILQFILMTVVVFQLPIVLEVLMVLNIVKRKALFKFGRYVVVLFFLVSALITPPDFVTQLGLAMPMTVLYYLTILVAKIFKFGEDKCLDLEFQKS